MNKRFFFFFGGTAAQVRGSAAQVRGTAARVWDIVYYVPKHPAILQFCWCYIYSLENIIKINYILMKNLLYL